MVWRSPVLDRTSEQGSGKSRVAHCIKRWDYAGDLEKDEIHPYLKFEWEKKNGGSIKLWKRTSQFLANKFPDAKNAIEIERTLMIESLENSPNFATTHGVIAQYPTFPI